LMKVGLVMLAGPKSWVELAQTAEACGFDSIWFPEHLIFPAKMSGKPGSPDKGEPPIAAETPVWDPFVVMSYLAGQTRTIRFGTNVYNIGLRHPFITARALATADLVSNGRVDFGIGSSWLREEWQATQLPFEGRGARVDESIKIIQRLFTEDEVEHSGKFFQFQPVRFEPKPVQKPWPPFFVGGDAPPALRRAALLGDGWIPMNQTQETLSATRKKIDMMRDDAGRSGPFQVIVQAGSNDLDNLRRWRDAGADRVITMPWVRPREGVDAMNRMADEILSKL
jgi:probable F420-dependent oxidoreductase